MQIIRKHFDTIDSTNTWAKHNAHLLPHDKITLITADSQTSGRGRFNRTWKSPPGQNIYATFCFFLQKLQPEIGNISQILALSTVHVLEKLGFIPTLKWPNDILMNNKKIAGILTETTSLSDRLCVIAGIGLNVNMPFELLAQIDKPATSLLVESGNPFNSLAVLELLQTQFLEDLELFIEKGFYPFLEDYRKYIGSPSTLVRFSDHKMVWEGTFQAINNDGSLSLRLSNGEIRTFLAGELI